VPTSSSKSTADFAHFMLKEIYEQPESVRRRFTSIISTRTDFPIGTGTSFAHTWR